jgi:hypothetical protein
MKLKSQADYLSALSNFIETQRHELPKNMVAKKKTIDNYFKATTIYMRALRCVYMIGDEEALKALCKEAWEIAEEVDTFLDSIIDLRRLHAIETILQ